MSNHTPVASNIWQTLSSKFCWVIDVGIPAISKHSLREKWASFQHCRSISTGFFVKRLLTVLIILTPASNFLKLVFIAFILSLQSIVAAINWNQEFKNGRSKSRPYHFKFFRGCRPQILLGYSWKHFVSNVACWVSVHSLQCIH